MVLNFFMSKKLGCSVIACWTAKKYNRPLYGQAAIRQFLMARIESPVGGDFSFFGKAVALLAALTLVWQQRLMTVPMQEYFAPTGTGQTKPAGSDSPCGSGFQS
jgi:hypothetical protein